jgi:hypothetical protein
MNTIKLVFLSRHGDLRGGWKILLFIVLHGAVAAALIVPLSEMSLLTALTTSAALLASGLVATFVMTRFINRKPLGAVGLMMHPFVLRHLLAGIFLGLLMIAGIFLVEAGLGYAGLSGRGLSMGDVVRTAGLSFLTLGFAAAWEELTFRGYMFQSLMQSITFLPAMLVFAALFSAAHWGNPNCTAFALVNVGLAAVLFSFAYQKTRSLWLPIGLHFGWNFTQTTLFSFPTSGNDFSSLQLFALAQTGPEWVTGGGFGPEGGMLATVALVVCTWHILKSTMYATPRGLVTLDSLEDILAPTMDAGGSRT